MICIGILGVAVLLFGYLTWYVSPLEIVQTVKVVANTESGCIVETLDGFPANIGPCDANEGDLISAKVDEKIKEREAAMNP